MSFFVSDALAADTTQAATAAQDVAGSPSPENMMADQFLLLGALFFIFYFILLRPQSQRVKAQKELLSKLAKGQKVITSGGLIGTVAKFEGDHVVILEVAQGVKVRVSRSAITEIFHLDAAAGESANDN